MKIVILSIVLLGLFTICLAEDATKDTIVADPHQGLDDRITNGQKAQPGEIPYQAFVLSGDLESENLTRCGGALIRPTWVLTAAHCITGSLTVVHLGSTFEDDMTYTKSVVQRIVHEGFFNNGKPSLKDVALLRLPSSPSGPGIAIGELAPENMDSLEGEIVRASGFGYVNQTHQSEDLLKANLKVISNEECNKVIGPSMPDLIHPSVMCTVGSSKPVAESACPGDSGGPLVYNKGGKDVIVGVTSFGEFPECNNKPAVFTRVSKYREWIDTTIAKNS